MEDDTPSAASVVVRAKKPSNSKFTQQTLPAFRPVPTLLSSIIIFVTIGIVFIIFGVIVLSYSQQVIQVRERYDTKGNCDKTEWDEPQTWTVEFEIDDDMDGPVFFYYELVNFFQNHRKYVDSFSYEQLKGDDLDEEELTTCDPVVTMDDLEKKPEHLFGGLSLDDDDVANPCGLIAKTVFNDTFVLATQGGTVISIDQDDIAWDVDKDEKFERLDDDWQKKQWIDVENEHFIVWMRPSGLPYFRKLWGKIDDDLDKGDYSVTIASNYPIDDFDGEKYFVLSTANAFGGKNDFLGIAYIIIGSLSICFAIFFSVKKCMIKTSIRPIK